MRKESFDLGSHTGWVYDYLDEPVGDDEDEYVERVVDKVPEIGDIGFGGYAQKQGLMAQLRSHVFSDSGEFEEYEVPEYLDILKDGLRECEHLFKNDLFIFVFPTFNEFILEEMNGVSGYCQWRNTILLFVNPVSGWRRALKECVVHEACHAIRLNDFEWDDLKDGLVFEGLAEHFREYFVGGEKANWVEKFTKEEALDHLDEIKNDFASQDREVYKEVFYGTGDYPHWIGYSIGYYIVEGYLESLESVGWEEVLETPPHRIIIESPFTTPLARE